MCHHYGLSVVETRKLPLKTFWMLSKNVDRIWAEQDLRLATLMGSVQSKEYAEKLIKDLRRQLGTIVEFEEAPKVLEIEPEYDRAGLLALKGMGKW